METELFAGVKGRFVEEVDDISAEAIFQATALFEVEGAGGIDFYIGIFAEDGSQIAMEGQGALPDLRHGECDYTIGHSRVGWTGEDARRSMILQG